MNKFIFTLFLFALFSCEKGQNPDPGPTPDPNPIDPTDSTYVIERESAVDVVKSEPTKVLMYYHSWYQTKEVDAYWGVRWRMNNRNPEIIDSSGRREIASHYYPTIGAYSSNDTLVLQLHALWMKYAGVDGITIDWFGKPDKAVVKNSTVLTMRQFDKIGLSSSVAYDDKTIQSAVAIHPIHDTAVFLSNDLKELADLSLEPYWTQHMGDPLLLVIGPSFAKSSSTWQAAITSASWSPGVFVGGGKSLRYPGGASEYAWPWGGDGNHYDVIKDFYRTKPNLEKMATIYSGVKDYYDEGGWSPGFSWEIGHHNGSTMDSLVDLAKDYTFPFLLVSTWNNFAEGSMVEPTEEFGTTFLEHIQDYTGVQYNAQDLDRCLRWYNASKAAESSFEKSVCRQIYFELISLDIQAAEVLLEYVE